METIFFGIYASIAMVMVGTLAGGLYAIVTKTVTATKYAAVQGAGRFALSALAGTAFTHYSLSLQSGTENLVGFVLAIA